MVVDVFFSCCGGACIALLEAAKGWSSAVTSTEIGSGDDLCELDEEERDEGEDGGEGEEKCRAPTTVLRLISAERCRDHMIRCHIMILSHTFVFEDFGPVIPDGSMRSQYRKGIIGKSWMKR